MEANNIKAMREALSRILWIADHLQTMFAIPKFPKLKRRHIILWRISVWFALTFWALPKRVLLYVLAFQLGLTYNICVFVKGIISTLCETSYEIGITFVSYFKACRYLIHAVSEEGDAE